MISCLSAGAETLVFHSWAENYITGSSDTQALGIITATYLGLKITYIFIYIWTAISKHHGKGKSIIFNRYTCTKEKEIETQHHRYSSNHKRTGQKRKGRKEKSTKANPK